MTYDTKFNISIGESINGINHQFHKSLTWQPIGQTCKYISVLPNMSCKAGGTYCA